MNEIQPCPICGKHPMFPPTYDPCDPSPEAVECCGFVAYTAELWSQYAAAMECQARHNALVEAVAWERDCRQDIRPLFAWSGLYLRHGEGYVDGVAEDLRAIQDAARAEVDRLIANDGAADCKGEG